MRHKIIPTNNNEKHSPFPCQSTTCLQERMKQTNIKKIHLVYSNLSSDNNKIMLVQQDKVYVEIKGLECKIHAPCQYTYTEWLNFSLLTSQQQLYNEQTFTILKSSSFTSFNSPLQLCVCVCVCVCFRQKPHSVLQKTTEFCTLSSGLLKQQLCHFFDCRNGQSMLSSMAAPYETLFIILEILEIFELQLLHQNYDQKPKNWQLMTNMTQLYPFLESKK